MKTVQDYVLVLDQQPDNLQVVESLLKMLQCPAVVTHSSDQVVARANQDFPYLIILVGNHDTWPVDLVNELRNTADLFGGTILSLTNGHRQSWPRHDENPGFDGFLVQPLSREVLMSLIQSAWARQLCCPKICPVRCRAANSALRVEGGARSNFAQVF